MRTPKLQGLLHRNVVSDMVYVTLYGAFLDRGSYGAIR